MIDAQDDRDGPKRRTAETRPTARPRAPERPAPKLPAWRDAGWQAAVEAIVRRAEADLWAHAGRPALDWLRGRGLADHTIRRFRLGFSPDWRSTDPMGILDEGEGPQPIKVAPGVLMPWPASPLGDEDDGGPRWVGANVRRLAEDPSAPLPPKVAKCFALKGSVRGFAYPWPEILPTQVGPPALVVEGELDSLIGHQEAGHLAHAVTVGGAGSTPDPSALGLLARCPWLLIATDHDRPGIEAAGRWPDRFPHKARRVVLPHGKDLGEFHQAGGDVAAWVASEVARLGLAPSTLPIPSLN